MKNKGFCSAFLSIFFFLSQAWALPVKNPCDPSNLFNLVNRPTIADSACPVPYKDVMIEAGYEYLNLEGGGGGQDYPEAVLRVGLPKANEFVAILPDYNLQTVAPRSGYSPSLLGLKHEVGYNERWLGAIEGYLILPTGGGAFGSNKYGSIFNGIIDYTIKPNLILSFVFGVGFESAPPLNGGGRFTTFNPDLVLSWQLSDKWQVFGEGYGQSKIAPNQGAGFNMDVGVLYALLKIATLDIEFGHRLSGHLGDFNNYYGLGGTLFI